MKTVLRVGVENPESVGDHMYFMALMALTSTPENLDRSRCIEIALVHDLAECIVGDITPEKFSGVSKEEKHKMEQEAMEKLVSVSLFRINQKMRIMGFLEKKTISSEFWNWDPEKIPF